MKILTRFCVAVFLLMLAAPMLQSAFLIFPKATLGGVEFHAKRPVLGVQNWFSGEFQKKYEKWLNERIGFRSYFVRTFNQVQFSLFMNMSSFKVPGVVIGRDYWLYEQVYIKTYNRNGDTPIAKLKKKVLDLKRLQDLMKARGKPLLLVIAPSKVEIYPEHLPDGILKPGRENRKTDYDRILSLLDEAGVNCIDARKVFSEKKVSQPNPLFSTGGTHWNYFGAGMIVGMIFERLELVMGRKLSNIECKSVSIDRKPFGSDNDLGELLNIWFSKYIIGPQVHPVFEKKNGNYLPDLLFVGDSFAFTLTDIIGMEGLCRQGDFFYYFKRNYAFNEKERSAVIDVPSVDWTKELLARDAVVIEINEHLLPDIGFGFVQAAIAGLEALDKQGVK